MIPRPPNLRHTRAAQAFTLAEVMFAVLILGIGLIAVASLFPVAGTLQRATANRVTALNVGRSGIATMLAKGIPASFAAANMTSATTAMVPQLTTGAILFPLAERTFPSTITDVTKRPFFWVPLYRKDAATGYQFFVVVVQTVGGEAPADTFVANAGNCLAGELVVQTDGIVKQLTADNNTNNFATANFWRAVTPGNVSRSMNVVPVGQGVIR